MAISRQWQLIRSFLIKTHNPRVRDYFRDLSAVADDDLSTGRSAARRTCLIDNDDSQNIALGKLLIFRDVVAKDYEKPRFWGLDTLEYLETVSHRPKVTLTFHEKKVDAFNNSRIPIRGVISCRLRDTDYTKTKVNALANTIYNSFVTPIFYYRRGTLLYLYKDLALGYNFQLRVYSEAEAKSVITQFFTIQGDGTPDWENKLKLQSDNKNYSTRESEVIMGDVVYKPRIRPVGTVHFSYAELVIPGLSEPITLVDVTGTRPRAIRTG